MSRITLSQITDDTLRTLVTLRERRFQPELWNSLAAPLDDTDRQELTLLHRFIRDRSLTRLNEATLWSRVIFPLLMMAEAPPAEAWAGIPIRAEFPAFVLEGVLDGVIGISLSGNLPRPFFVVAEAKRGMEAGDSQPQLFAELIAVARTNWEVVNTVPQELLGCYNVGDYWTFVHAQADGLDTERPTLEVTVSREYAARVEAKTVLGLLKGIVLRSLAAWAPHPEGNAWCPLYGVPQLRLRKPNCGVPQLRLRESAGRASIPRPGDAPTSSRRYNPRYRRKPHGHAPTSRRPNPAQMRRQGGLTSASRSRPDAAATPSGPAPV